MFSKSLWKDGLTNSVMIVIHVIVITICNDTNFGKFSPVLESAHSGRGGAVPPVPASPAVLPGRLGVCTAAHSSQPSHRQPYWGAEHCHDDTKRCASECTCLNLCISQFSYIPCPELDARVLLYINATR